MRRVLTTIAVVAGIGCIAGAPAGAATSATRVPFATVVGDNPCTGESVAVEGTLLVVARTTTGPSGTLSSGVVVVPTDVTAIGTETGTAYGYHGATTSSFTLHDGTSVTDTSTIVLTQPGSGAELLVHLLFHETLTPTGEVATVVEGGGATCAGST